MNIIKFGVYQQYLYSNYLCPFCLVVFLLLHKLHQYYYIWGVPETVPLFNLSMPFLLVIFLLLHELHQYY
jgi:hypothetical protein